MTWFCLLSLALAPAAECPLVGQHSEKQLWWHLIPPGFESPRPILTLCLCTCYSHCLECPSSLPCLGNSHSSFKTWLPLSPPPGSLPEVPAPSRLTFTSHLYPPLAEACDFWGAQEGGGSLMPVGRILSFQGPRKILL